MYTTVEWNGYVMDVDLDATQAWYRQAEDWYCPCGHCRNYLALEGQLPEYIQAFFRQVGIAHRKAGYVCEMYHENGRLLYDVSYPVFGVIRKGRDPKDPCPEAEPQSAENHFYPPGFGEGVLDPWFVFQLNIWLPWVLPEPVDGIPTQTDDSP